MKKNKTLLFYSLSDNRSLWITLVLSIVITIAFLAIGSISGLIFLDTISDPSEVRFTLSSMSQDHKIFHAWITLTLDVAYPLAYGALFIGSAYKFYVNFGWLIALPFYVLVLTDLIEGLVQVLALTGVADFIDAKLILTPLKNILVVLGIVTTTNGFLLWVFARKKKRQLQS